MREALLKDHRNYYRTSLLFFICNDHLTVCTPSFSGSLLSGLLTSLLSHPPSSRSGPIFTLISLLTQKPTGIGAFLSPGNLPPTTVSLLPHHPDVVRNNNSQQQLYQSPNYNQSYQRHPRREDSHSRDSQEVLEAKDQQEINSEDYDSDQRDERRDRSFR